jgi:hypothetical protein
LEEGKMENSQRITEKITLSSSYLKIPFLIYIFYLLFFPFSSLSASESLCAKVKIEIKQELTLERQAFDAHMKINNGLSHVTLEDVGIDVKFTNKDGESVSASFDPDDTEALFFIRVDSIDNIDNIEGSGTVAPSTSADIHWLIIPAPGTSEGLEMGTLYYVGATLTYTIGGEEYITEVSPDYIFVKPMPELTLDYFLPYDVYGDDAFTQEIEPPIPFSLGVRVKNNGYGSARSLKIDSAQPKIIDNEQGLLVGFVIEGCQVNGEQATKSLTADFGNIAPNLSGIARWIMTCSLSGEFVEFNAQYSHSDELGGELTSLIENITTHTLIQDVLVDLPGRDNIRDFMAIDGADYKVFESESIDNIVVDQSTLADLQLSGQSGSEFTYNLSTPVTSGFMYVQLSDPQSEQKVIKEVVRSDGKFIKPENVWLSKTGGANNEWEYFFNLFDVNTTSSYKVIFDDASEGGNPPVLQFIPDRTGLEEQQLSFIVEATDPDGTVPSLSASPLPAGASFADQGDGTAIFDWTPGIGQAGQYEISFKASDGELEGIKHVMLTICTLANPDCQNAPTIPEILSPVDGSETTVLSPSLVINNSTDPDGDDLSYEFEVYSDREMTNLVVSSLNVPEAEDTTSWTIPEELSDNKWYYFRVRATDGTAFSLWTYGKFFVNTENDPPGDFNISSPMDQQEVDTLTPVLEVTNSVDVDEDIITYNFMVYEDEGMTSLVASASGIEAGENGTTSWVVDVPLNNSTLYYWKAIAIDGTETSLISFLVNTANTAPDSPVVSSPAPGSEIGIQEVTLTVNNAVDSDGDDLTYFFELDSVNTFDSEHKRVSVEILEGEDTTGWYVSELEDNMLYYWRVTASDGTARSTWAVGSFFVNTVNNMPSIPTVRNPGQGAWVDTLTPALHLNPSLDIDNDGLIYRFEVYPDASLTEPIVQGESEIPQWAVPTPLNNNTWYYWRAQAEDEHGLSGLWMNTASFFVKDDGIDDPPEITILEPSQDILTNANIITITWEDSDPDSNGDISLYYDTDSSAEDGTPIQQGITEDPDGSGDTYLWDITGMEDGTYYVYAIITDGNSSGSSYGQGAITIDRTPPVVSASPVGGTYSSAQSVTLTASETADIFYTKDESEPTIDSLQYTSPIEITDNKTLKFIAIDTAGNPSETVTETYIISTQQDYTVKVETSKGRELAGLNVYAFTDSDSYTGKHALTDENGIATFSYGDFQEGNYKFRIDYSDYQFWSDVITIPYFSTITVIIEEETLEATVTTFLGPIENIRVYLFTESGSYLGLYENSDEFGRVSFDLPVGMNFKLRADYLENQYWSDIITISGGGTNNISIDMGGGFFQITVQKDMDNPMEGIKVYLFNSSSSYLGIYQTTDSSGMAGFNVPAGTFKVRVDYLGYQFWSADIPVTENIGIYLTIPHQQVNITVNGLFQSIPEPLEGINVYLFTPSDSYLSLSALTDENGQVSFDLPEKGYKVRADYLSQQFWSSEFIWEETIVNIPMADAEIAVIWNDMPLSGVQVYVFLEDGTYLNIHGPTDGEGKITFRLPAATYKFRADYQGSQYWSGEQILLSDQVNPITISTGGGAFTLTVLKEETVPLTGVSCYVFSEDDTYLNMNGTNSNEGQVSFNLSDGSYKIRVDHLGYQFWTEIFILPGTLDITKTIAHQDVIITVERELSGDIQPMINIPVYLYTSSDSYLSLSELTDEAGQVVFNLPEKGYKVRADYLSQQFWSPEFIWQDNTITVYEGTARVKVSMGGQDMQDVPVYVFSESSSDLGIYGTTDVYGLVDFNLPAGTYKFRADYQNNEYWATADIIQDIVNTVDINMGGGDFVLTVDTGSGPLVGVNVYAFTSGGSYLGMYGNTDDNGIVSFGIGEGSYKFRVDHIGYQFWTEIFDVPDTLSGTFTIQHQNVVITVEKLYETYEPVSGVNVYLFTPSGSYLSQYQITDEAGQVAFNLPQMEYKVRIDYLSQQFWSEVFQSADTTVTINHGLVDIHVHRSGASVEGAKVSLFTEGGSYLGWYETTDLTGKVEFLLPDLSFKFRADEGSDQVFSPVINIIPGEINSVEIDLDA